MKHNRLLYVFFSMLLFTAQFAVSMEADLAEDVAENMTESLGEDVGKEAGDAEKSEALQGGDEALQQFMNKNKDIIKDQQAFKDRLTRTVNKEQAELQETAKSGEESGEDLVREGTASGAENSSGETPPGENPPDGSPEPEAEPATPEISENKKLTKDGLLGDTDYAKDPKAAREQYGKVAQTKNLVEKTEGALSKTVSATRDSLEEYATRMKAAERDITGVAKKYSTDLTNIPKNALKKLDGKLEVDVIKDGKVVQKDVVKDVIGKDGEPVIGEDGKVKTETVKENLKRSTTPDELQKMLNSTDRAQIEAASKEVAKLKALSRVGDIDSIIGKFAEKGASRDMADAMLDDTIGNVNKSFDDLDKAMEDDPDFFKETTEKEPGDVTTDAKGGQRQTEGKEVKTSPFTKFLDKAESDLESGIKKQADEYVSECDLASSKLAKDGNIGTFAQARIKAAAYLRNPADLMGEKVDSLATDLKTTSRYDLKDKASEVVDGIGSRIKGAGEKLAGMAEMLVSAVVFMIPNIFQSTFLAQQSKAAAMASWGNPIKYGGKVYQIPDSCINLGSPTSSWPIYAQIPVNNVGDAIPSDVSTLFNGSISGPTTSNALASAIHSASSEIFSFGTTSDTSISRYKMDEGKFLPLTDIAVVYGGPGAYVTPGSIAMNSSQFTGQVISLRTGLVTDATGDVVDATGLPSAKSVPLISVTQWGGLTPPNTSPISQGMQSVEQFLPSILAKEEVAGSKVTYTQYSNVGSGSKGLSESQAIQDLLDTECVTSAGSLSQSACPCVIVDGLESLSAGLSIDASGNSSTVFRVNTPNPQQFLKVSSNNAPVITAAGTIASSAPGASTSSNKSSVLGRLSTASGTSAASSATTSAAPAASTGWNGLGAVVPVFGWGKNQAYNNIFSATAFPGFDPASAGVAGIERVGSISADNMITAGQGVTGEASTVFASEDELWAAKGCWIYLCANTPFAQYIQQGVTTPQTLTGPYVDYIVFMDEDVNIVPLMVPVTVDIEVGSSGASYKKAQMFLNPAIKYWTSLVAYNLPDFAQDNQPIMYDLQGNVYPYSGLGSLAGATPPAGSQGPTGIIPTFLTAQSNSIQAGFPEIYNQFQLHSAALIYRMGNMPIPYANCSLTTSAVNNLTIGKATLTTYTGLNCWQSSVGGDYLIPLDNYVPASASSTGANSGNPTIGNPLTLPDSEAQYLVSLVTDIVYQLQDNAWVPFDFTNSMLNLDTNNQPIKTANGSYEVNASDESTFYFMSGFYNQVTPAASLVADLTSKRAAWLKNMGVELQLGSGSSAITCTLAAGISQTTAKATGSYIYQLNPSPSAALVSGQDYFVAVDTAAPALGSLKPISILKASQKSGTLVSLLTGTLYDMTGSPIAHQNGLPKRIAINAALMAGGKTSAQVIYSYVTDKLFKNLSDEFTSAYESSVKAYSAQQAQPQGPYSFGQFQVAIRSGDLANGTYVYFSAGGMHKSNFKPRDLYVILTPASSGSGYNIAQYDSTQTQYLLSLITGVAYDQNGQLAMTLPATDLQSMITGWSVGWSPWILSTLKEMQTQYSTRLARYTADNERVEKELSDFSQKHDAALNKEQSEIAAIIARLQPAGSGLPVPFPELQYDATTGQYVHPSPAGTSTDSGLIYLFMGSGKVYKEDGSYVTQYQPAHLKAVRDQYGVVVDPKTKVQKLGIPMMQPSLLLPEEDLALTVGVSGESMIASNDVDFPGDRMVLPARYGLFFSKIMDTYYVLDSATLQWMSVDGGHLYEQDGAPVVVGNQVALAAKDDVMLLYANNDGYQQAFMSDGSEYSNLSSSNSTMNWMGLSAPYSEFTVTANAALTQYSVGKKTYKVNDAYTWHSLVLVPIDDKGVLLSEIPDSSYRFIRLVMNDKVVTNVLYHDEMYKVISTSSAVTSKSYTLKPVNAKSGGSTITLTTGLLDVATNAPYVVIVDGSDTYQYCYEPQSFDNAQQIANRANIWTGATSASPLPLAVGPMHERSKQIGGQTVTMSVPDFVTHTLFTRDLPSKNGAVIAPVAVSARSVVGAPSVKDDPTEYSTLQLGLVNVVETKDNRFLCALSAWTGTPQAGVMSFPYVSKAAYVDLKTGALFDQVSGVAKGQCLNMKDLLTVLDTCAVMITDKTITYQEGTGKNKKTVTKNTKGKNIMVYRSSTVSQQQAASVESDATVAAAGQGTVVVNPSQVGAA